MARPKVYPRHQGEDGIVYIQLIDANVLRDLDTSWITDDFSIQSAVRMFNDYARAGAVWFFIETGIEPYVEQTPDGVVWGIDDTKPHSQKYPWLQRKAQRSIDKIIARINESGKEITDRQRMLRMRKEEAPDAEGPHETGEG